MDVKTARLPLTTLNEQIFWDEDDPRRRSFIYKPQYGTGFHDVCFDVDSYIICFTGVRGGGKTTAMTYLAAKANYLYGMRIISNFDIQYKLFANGKSRVVRSEPLDLYKLMIFDESYKGCLILIDEAPDIISHLASMTWRNRLLNLWCRQIRKNTNSLFLGAQDFGLIDKSMRWQVDIEAQCQDMSKKYGLAPELRGHCIMLRLVDNSGSWKGERDEDYLRRMRFYHKYVPDPALKLELFPAVLWGMLGKTRPVFDSWKETDIFQTLQRVDLKLTSIKIAPPTEEQSTGDIHVFESAVNKIVSIQAGTETRIRTSDYWASLGPMSRADKDLLSKRLSRAGVKVGQASNGKRYYDFDGFDVNTFIGAQG